MQHLSVMLCSLLAKNQKHTINSYVIIPTGTQECKLDKIRKSIHGSSSNLQFRSVDRRFFEKFKIFGHITSTAYFKLLIGELLPVDMHRVLYIDADIIVRGDLEELWNYYLDDSVIGAVEDSNMQFKETLGLRPNEPYFNSGVLLVDLDQWRADCVGPRARDFALSHPDRITYADQCALNWILRDRWKPLPERWNLQTASLARTVKGARRQAKTAQIVHFSGPCKPWLYMTRHPVKREYLAYLSLTEWKNYKYPDYFIRNFISKNIHDYVPFMLRIHRVMLERLPIWRRVFKNWNTASAA